MEDYDKKFAIMLSKHLVDVLDNWPISEVHDTLEKIRNIKESSDNPTLLSKNEYEAFYVEPKALINPETNQVEYGTVFQLNQI